MVATLPGPAVEGAIGTALSLAFLPLPVVLLWTKEHAHEPGAADPLGNTALLVEALTPSR